RRKTRAIIQLATSCCDPGLNCAAIRHQKLATVRQQAFAGNVMDAPHEIGISFGRVIVLRLEHESARGDFCLDLHHRPYTKRSWRIRAMDYAALGEGTRQL